MDTVADLLPRIRALGGREAIRWISGFRTEQASYAELYGRIGACAVYLKERGIGRGDRVLIRAENRPEWVAVFWACIAGGIHAVPVDSRFSPELTERIRADSQARLIIDSEVMDALARAAPASHIPIAPLSPDDILEIVYTSGTTGEPKGVVHRHRNICANLRPFEKEIQKYRRWAAPFQPVRILDLLPLSHMFGQSQGIFIPLFLGGSVAFTDEFHPAGIAEIVRSNHISVVVCVPRMLEMFRNEITRRFQPRPGVGGAGMSGIALRWWKYRKVHSYLGWKFWAFVVGGARIDPSIEEFLAQMGFAVIQGYGLTEASPVVAVNHPFASRRGSLGKAVPGQEVILAADGEILVRGESVAGAVDEAGWLHTGDLGEIDREGRLYYRGRKKDLIVTPEGLNVVPDDVESVLNQFSEIKHSAVVGIDDHVHAALILKSPTANPAEIIRQANERLESHQRIHAWSVWADEDFPRTPSTMKLRRAEVAERIRSGQISTPELIPDPHNMSSLERVELLSELEARHGINIDEEAFAKVDSANDLRKLIDQSELETSDQSRNAPDLKGSVWPTRFPLRWVRNVFQFTLALPLFHHYLPLTVEGIENLDDLQPPVLFAANHTSDLDTPAIFTSLPFSWRKRVAPAMRAEYFRGHSAQYLISRLLYNGYLLPQEVSGVRKALAITGELVRRGYCPLVYPEGRRTHDGALQSFRPGIGMMAVRLRIPVIPMYLEGLFDIYSIHDSWPKRGPVRVVIGAPLRFSATASYEDAAQEIRHAIDSLSHVNKP